MGSVAAEGEESAVVRHQAISTLDAVGGTQLCEQKAQGLVIFPQV